MIRNRTYAAAMVLLLSLFFSSGCATTPKTEMTQLQIRQFQTRIFDEEDTKMVLKAIVNVLQDEGFIIREASSDLGILHAVKEKEESSPGGIFLATLFGGNDARWNANSVMECTANVSEFGKQCKVRVNFQSKVLDNKGAVVKVRQVDDLKFYQTFFEKVDKGIFLQRQKL